MSLYAKIEDNIVVNVILCEDSVVTTLPGFYVKETELTNQAVIGSEYVAEKNKFKLAQPYSSWTLNEETMIWECPVAKPEGAKIWDEYEQSWIIPE